MLRNILFIVFPVIFLIHACVNPSRQIYDLRCENLENPLSITHTTPHLSWKNKFGEKGNKQTAFQILVATDPSLLEEGKADLWTSGKIPSSESVMIKYGGKDLAGHSLVYWKVCVWDVNDRIIWSEPAVFGAGLSEKEIRTATYIGFPEASGNPQSPLLRKQFSYDGKVKNTLLYINSLGYHEVYINGTKVGDDVLTPAVSQLDKRSLYNTYDITSYVKRGDNEMVIWLGQGWYRPGLFGALSTPLVKAWVKKQDEGKWDTWFVSDQSWQAAESGYSGIGTWRPHQFGGERIDASMFPDNMESSSLDNLQWYPVAEMNVSEHAVSPQMVEGNRITETFHAANVKQLSDGAWLADMGKAFTGCVEIKFPPLDKGQEIVLTYSDHLNPEGNPVNQNQEDRYIASGRRNEIFRSKFNYHGFQYLKISNLPVSPKIDDITARLIQTAFKQTSSFQCSDEDMNAIHDMVQYTLRNLSLGGYLVDCTQFERLGYGGDGNASTVTAQTMFDLSPLYANWMQAWADCIRGDGSMPHTAPNPYSAGGGPYWCGFIITASWNSYVNYADPRFMEEYYPVMQQWLGFVDQYMVNGLLEPWPSTEYRNWYLGDWAVPENVDQTNPASVGVVNNCFISVCYETMEKIAKFLGKENDVKKYAERKKLLQKRIHEHFYSEENGIYATGSQIDLAYPMLSGVTPDSLFAKVKQSLFDETEQNRQGHLACGLVGIPVITEWAVKNRQPDFIYTMLKKRDYPGYLYMIDNGATATWEHWNGERSRLHNCYNSIGSWFYQAVGGIRPDEKEPGYRKIWIDPQIPEGMTWCKTAKETPYGVTSVEWTLTGNVLNMEIAIPPGSNGCVVLADKADEYILNGNKLKNKDNMVVLENGKHQISYAWIKE
ncbi:MAG: glycoside hydrolase family 78 protein [Bacteroidales bacterium]|jgi:alpha-L-rhamnosidase|nr:glycoside hydrolase family 78 protein [Bacteroidales bacterium]